MGRPPLHAAAMSKREIDARHRRTAAQHLADAYTALLDAAELLMARPKLEDRLAFARKHAATLNRAYAAQKRGE